MLPRATTNDSEAVTWLRKIGAQDMSEAQQTALLVMQRGEAITLSRYRQMAGATAREAAEATRELIDRHLIRPRHVGRTTKFALTPEESPRAKGTPAARRPAPAPRTTRPARNAATLGVRQQRADRRPDILALLQRDGALSATELAARLGMTSAPVKRWLRRLVDEKQVESIATTPTDPRTRYRIPS